MDWKDCISDYPTINEKPISNCVVIVRHKVTRVVEPAMLMTTIPKKEIIISLNDDREFIEGEEVNKYEYIHYEDLEWT